MTRISCFTTAEGKRGVVLCLMDGKKVLLTLGDLTRLVGMISWVGYADKALGEVLMVAGAKVLQRKHKPHMASLLSSLRIFLEKKP
jgi:hypothetical protein